MTAFKSRAELAAQGLATPVWKPGVEKGAENGSTGQLGGKEGHSGVSTASLETHANLAGERVKRREFIALCRQSGVLVPVPEYAFAGSVGRKFRFDYAWPEQRLALECDGGLWSAHGAHTTGKGAFRDREKGNIAALLGWRVLRVTPGVLCSDDTLELVRRGLAYDPLGLSWREG